MIKPAIEDSVFGIIIILAPFWVLERGSNFQLRICILFILSKYIYVWSTAVCTRYSTITSVLTTIWTPSHNINTTEHTVTHTQTYNTIQCTDNDATHQNPSLTSHTKWRQRNRCGQRQPRFNGLLTESLKKCEIIWAPTGLVLPLSRVRCQGTLWLLYLTSFQHNHNLFHPNSLTKQPWQ